MVNFFSTVCWNALHPSSPQFDPLDDTFEDVATDLSVNWTGCVEGGRTTMNEGMKMVQQACLTMAQTGCWKVSPRIVELHRLLSRGCGRWRLFVAAVFFYAEQDL